MFIIEETTIYIWVNVSQTGLVDIVVVAAVDVVVV